MFTHSAHLVTRGAFRPVLAILSLAIVTAAAATAAPGRAGLHERTVRIWTIHYTAHNGRDRLAYVVLPSWYGPGNNPVLPVVISPHGRSATGRSNAAFWDNLPAVGGFAVI